MPNPEGPSPSTPGPNDPDTPTPEQDPHEPEPMRDPPMYPERDFVGVEEICEPGGRSGGIEAPDPPPDATVGQGIEG
jgi:hypothetical protein